MTLGTREKGSLSEREFYPRLQGGWWVGGPPRRRTGGTLAEGSKSDQGGSNKASDRRRIGAAQVPLPRPGIRPAGPRSWLRGPERGPGSPRFLGTTPCARFLDAVPRTPVSSTLPARPASSTLSRAPGFLDAVPRAQFLAAAPRARSVAWCCAARMRPADRTRLVEGSRSGKFRFALCAAC